VGGFVAASARVATYVALPSLNTAISPAIVLHSLDANSLRYIHATNTSNSNADHCPLNYRLTMSLWALWSIKWNWSGKIALQNYRAGTDKFNTLHNTHLTVGHHHLHVFDRSETSNPCTQQTSRINRIRSERKCNTTDSNSSFFPKITV
jgi:hypothetical protein